MAVVMIKYDTHQAIINIGLQTVKSAKMERKDYSEELE